MKKILVLGNYTDAMYHPLTDVCKRLKEIVSDSAFTFTEDPSMLLKSEDYDLVVSYWDDWKNPINKEAAEALINYVKNGGALFGIHNGISLQMYEEFINVFGGKFLYHPEQEILKIKTNTIGEDKPCDSLYFEVMEEPYQYELLDDDKKIIMTYEYRGKEYPGGWEKTYGLGKVVYVFPGHTYEKFDIAGFRNVLKMCFDYLLNK